MTSGHCVQRDGPLGLVPLELHSTLCTLLEEVNSTGSDEYAMMAGCFRRVMEPFTTFFGLKLCFTLFSTTEQLSCTLQSKGTTLQDAKGAVILTVSRLRRQRKDDAFDTFYESVMKESQDLSEAPTLPRR